MREILLEWIPGRFAVWRGNGASDEAANVPRSGNFFSVTRTPDEWSVVTIEENVPQGTPSEAGWVGVRAVGTLSFDMVGVLARLLAPLAEANISVFVVSTYATDYVFVKAEFAERAHEALSAAADIRITNKPF